MHQVIDSHPLVQINPDLKRWKQQFHPGGCWSSSLLMTLKTGRREFCWRRKWKCNGYDHLNFPLRTLSRKAAVTSAGANNKKELFSLRLGSWWVKETRLHWHCSYCLSVLRKNCCEKIQIFSTFFVVIEPPHDIWASPGSFVCIRDEETILTWFSLYWMNNERVTVVVVNLHHSESTVDIEGFYAHRLTF